MNQNLSSYRIFYTVANTGNISKAAKELYISQPAISKQIRQLERTVSGYFDYIEDLIERENTFTMEQFAASINEFLSFRRYDILPDKGKVSARQARAKAEAEYDLFNPTQKIVSDFDRTIRQMKEEN